ncbi:MAG: septum formation initiator family protein [Nitrospirae bacterium]|nr:septum formation initiator family protein [Nitrospirota bacterium]
MALVVGGIVAAFFVVSFFFGEMGLPKYLNMVKYARQLESDIQEIQRTSVELRTEIDRLEHDPRRIEELARERLGLVRKGETVYHFLEGPDAASADE